MSEIEIFKLAVEISKTIGLSCKTQQETKKLLKLIARIVEIRWVNPL